MNDPPAVRHVGPAEAVSIGGPSNEADYASPPGAATTWSRWRIETHEQFFARVMDDARRLGFLRLVFTPANAKGQT